MVTDQKGPLHAVEIHVLQGEWYVTILKANRFVNRP